MVLSKWDDTQTAKCDGDLLALRVYTSCLMSDFHLPFACPLLHAPGCRIPACRKCTRAHLKCAGSRGEGHSRCTYVPRQIPIGPGPVARLNACQICFDSLGRTVSAWPWPDISRPNCLQTAAMVLYSFLGPTWLIGCAPPTSSSD